MKKLMLSFLLAATVSLTGCGFHNSLEYAYNQDALLNIEYENTLEAVKAASFGDTYAVIPYDYENNIFEQDAVGSALLINTTTNDVLVAHNVHEKIYPASITKIMTAILVAEALDNGTLQLEETITLREDVTFSDDHAARLALKAGDSITVKDLLYCFLVRSLNDCGVVLAKEIAGSEEAFVALMNEKAYELGAVNTHFVNCHGLHDENHYTTSYDLYLIFTEFEKHSILTEIDATKEFDLQYTNGDGEKVELLLKSTNGYITEEYDLPEGFTIGGWKSGTTTEAGYCLIMEVTAEDGQTYVAMIGNDDSRDELYQSMSQLLEYTK